MAVRQLIRVSITVADLSAAAAFYRDALGLEVGPEQSLTDPAWDRLLGLRQGTKARAADVAIGRQTIKLVAFDPPGWSYPKPRASNEQWFEHVALVTGDVKAAWQRLEAASPETITRSGPVRLPPNTGGVTAFKFRDPEGHPLELISFPKGVGDPVWQQQARSGIAGYDHTAIAVDDLDQSLAFYTEQLGMRIVGRSLNQGSEQDRLDGLKDCQVDVVALAPQQVPPHLELLHYRTPEGRSLSAAIGASDVASARQVYRVDDLDALASRLEAADVAFVSPGIVALKSGARAAAIRDPDRHMIVLMD
jgi:catechol 2,3-dioxygenase-like lactoylglutathione lyase family enzyme